jgi:hypothetical protein
MSVERIQGHRNAFTRQPRNGDGLGNCFRLSRDDATGILANRESTAAKQAKRRFREWASLFSGKLFVMLAAYTDESETAGFGAFGGYVASVDEWEEFAVEWQQILNDFKIDYFHFSEWAMASAIIRGKRPPHSTFNENQYSTWALSDLDSFLLKLGKVAGALKKGAFGAYISIDEFNRRKAIGDGIPNGAKHRDYCLRACFSAFIDALDIVWPRYAESVSFFWDITQDTAWKKSIIDAYEPFWKKYQPCFSEISFADDKTRLPLQAADMIAYRMRQRSEKFSRDEAQVMSDLDKALFPEGGGYLQLSKINLNSGKPSNEHGAASNAMP